MPSAYAAATIPGSHQRPNHFEKLLEAHLNEFRTWYNTERPHQSLGR
ncbi:integrase core domain-containing protein [Gordonia sp. (in: high G+C Gram-positive bacteria)]|nr:transposase [Gordonia sp. (in: high G+C Gram-positive bacteria)]